MIPKPAIGITRNELNKITSDVEFPVSPSKRHKPSNEDFTDCAAEFNAPKNNMVDSFILATRLVRIRFLANHPSVCSNKCCVTPDFTHQVFEEEKVVGIRSREICGTASIVVNCTDLLQEVHLTDDFANDERDIILSKLSKALPDGHNIEHASQTPPGQLLCQFAQPSNSVVFELYLATAHDSGASELLHRAEKLAIWFIETADSVDFSDERWGVLFLYAIIPETTPLADKVETNTEREFVGYMTVFSFRNPIHGTKARVCQALVLPPWQGRGLGREMLLRVYEHIVHARDEVSELTVEDPCPGFQRLRDAVDLELLVRHFPSVLPRRAATTASNIEEGDCQGECEGSINRDVVDTSKEIACAGAVSAVSLGEAQIARKLKVIKAQAQFLDECLDFFALVRDITAGNGVANTTGTAVESAVQDTTTPATEPERSGPGRVDETAAPAATLPTGTSLSSTSTSSCTSAPLGVTAVTSAQLEAHPDFKEFRLNVKRRILKNDKDIAALPKADKQRALSEEFEVEFKRFMALLKTATKLGLI